MAAPSAAVFRARYPFFDAATWPDATVDMYIEEAADEVSLCIFGYHWEKAVMLLAAHRMTLEAPALEASQVPVGGSAGLSTLGPAHAIKKAKVGDTEAQFAVSETSGEDVEALGTLTATQFGQQFLRLRSRMARGGIVANRRQTLETCASRSKPVY